MYSTSTPEQRAAQRLRHRERHPDYFRNYQMVRQYGITADEYDALFAACGGLCAVCQRPESAERGGRIKRLAVDHNHETGAVRSLLCSNCNTGLGKFDDDVELLQKALDYLRRFEVR